MSKRDMTKEAVKTLERLIKLSDAELSAKLEMEAVRANLEDANKVCVLRDEEIAALRKERDALVAFINEVDGGAILKERDEYREALENVVESKALMEAPFYGYCESILNAKAVLAKHEEQP